MRLELLGAISFGLLSLGGAVTQAPKVTEKTLQLEGFGFKAGPCVSSQSVHFLDDNRLVLGAPRVSVCDKSSFSKALPTELTLIDLHGTVLATNTRPDIYALKDGPIGYVVACTEQSLELVSGDLRTIKVIPTNSSSLKPCSDVDGLSPSRTAISIRTYGELPKSPAMHRLIDPRAKPPIIEKQFEKGDSLAGITDTGYAICKKVGNQSCERLTVDGFAWATGSPYGGIHLGLFLSPKQLLLPPVWTEKVLISLSSDGEKRKVMDLRGLQPRNVDNESIEMSAMNPRRVLYSATGCYIGDFDDCYGLIFKRDVVFDPQTHEVLLKQNVGRDSTSVLSPNGKILVVLDKTSLHIYAIP